jgi:hypothetical protein
VLLKHATEEELDEILARIADVRGRLVKLRASILGPGTPKLVESARPESRGKR